MSASLQKQFYSLSINQCVCVCVSECTCATVCSCPCLWCLCLQPFHPLVANKASSHSSTHTAGCGYSGCVCVCVSLCVYVCGVVWLSVLSVEGEICFLKMSHECWDFYCSPDNFYSTPRAVYICGNWTGFPRKQHHFLWLFTLKVLSSLFRFSLGEGAFERHLTG